ncbi:MAG: AgmX/PglI C-terminal domain-containing protein [Myxococcales bacterium]
MKFVCDSCHAQYLISDEKVGPNGVIVRCKKCQHKIVVKRAEAPEKEEATVVAATPGVASASAAGSPPPGTEENKVPEEKAGIDDELGRAFESVLSKQGVGPGQDTSALPTAAEMPAVGGPADSGALGLAASAGSPGGFPSLPDDSEDSDRQSTRVVNLSQMASMIKAEAQQEAAAQIAPPPSVFEEKPKEKEKEKKNGSNGSAAAASGADWFVAINDAQVGPLTIEGVGEKWEKGELSADSLCWKTGMPDWKPLSSVPELAEKLAPRPAPEPEKAAPAGATATGAQAPAPTPLPPQQDEPGEPEWKPSAASALASLVQDELAALAKPPEKKEEPPPADSKPRGLLDDLPEATGSRPALQAPPPSDPLPSDDSQVGGLPASRRAEAESHDEPPPPAVTPERRSRPPQRTSRPPYEEDEPQVYRPPKSNTGLIVGGIIGGVALLCVTIIVVVVLTRGSGQPVQPPPALPPVAAVNPQVNPPTANPAQPQPIGTAPVKPPDVKPAEPTPTPPAADVKTGEPPKTDPPKAEVGKTEPVKADPPKTEVAKTDPPKTEKQPAATPKQPKEPQRVAAAEKKDPPKAVVKTEEPEKDNTPAVRKPSANKVDDDFENIFGGDGKKAEPAPTPKAEKDKPKTVYIPPAPGSGSTPAKAQLEQSDIMAVVVENKSMIKACVDETKAKDPGASGTIVMRWTILPNGGVSNIQVKTEEYRKTPLSACLTNGIKKFKFPAYSGAQMPPVDFPFKF